MWGTSSSRDLQALVARAIALLYSPREATPKQAPYDGTPIDAPLDDFVSERAEAGRHSRRRAPFLALGH
jgi:hypothetical protein